MLSLPTFLSLLSEAYFEGGELKKKKEQMNRDAEDWTVNPDEEGGYDGKREETPINTDYNSVSIQTQQCSTQTAGRGQSSNFNYSYELRPVEFNTVTHDHAATSRDATIRYKYCAPTKFCLKPIPRQVPEYPKPSVSQMPRSEFFSEYRGIWFKKREKD